MTDQAFSVNATSEIEGPHWALWWRVSGIREGTARNEEVDMTDTRSFRTTAVKRATGEWKVFYGFFAATHHAAAIEWLGS